jgi:hypothetical protein
MRGDSWTDPGKPRMKGAPARRILQDVTDHPLTDVERRQAGERLREHMLTGRLPDEQYRARLSMLGQLRTFHEAEALFYDLPEPRLTAPSQQWSQPPFAPGQSSATGQPSGAGSSYGTSTSYGTPGSSAHRPPAAPFPPTGYGSDYTTGPVVGGPGASLQPTTPFGGMLARVSSASWRNVLGVLWPVGFVLWIATGSFAWVLMPLIASPFVRRQFANAKRRESAASGYGLRY